MFAFEALVSLTDGLSGKGIARHSAKRWVFLAGGLLSAIAGYVNVVMLSFFAVPVSHMSGPVSRLSIDIAVADLADLMLVAGILAGFLFGAMLSGLLIGSATLRAGKRYGGVLILQGAILSLATVMALNDVTLAVPLAALACGLQNAMASSYRGLELRTTHVTGIVTDIGVLIGQRLRQRYIRIWKLWLLLTLLFSFFAGGIGGALLVKEMGMGALGVAAAACVVLGAGYIIVQHRVNIKSKTA
ncbi:MAG: DUF1275 domain-containing protein [Gammaproteobacteria bacterium HGW-Gammaproteobacteria-14]|nr:MAG: DUF1275 domain-containing protein [Gammaproteobacteria bacterium HGW-Gammaproteobacteria-14]